MYEYRARCLRVVDGDTVDLLVDVGFNMNAKLRFRLMDIDAPELRRGPPELRVQGKASKEFVEQALIRDTQASGPWPLRIHTQKADSFGRWLANIYITYVPGQDERNLAEMLLKEGLAMPYEGRT